MGGDNGSPVTLYVYDISRGMARQFSAQFLGKHFDGIWHTAIVVFGREYFFGGGIMVSEPLQTPFGSPVKQVSLGETLITKELFEDFLQGLSPRYLPETYHVLDNNCNNFTEECSQFLTGNSIPDDIKNLPNEFLSTPLGGMLKPMIDGFFQNQRNNLQQYSMFGDVPALHSNGSTPSPSYSNPPFPTPPVTPPTPQFQMLSHSQPTFFTVANVPQIFSKLRQWLDERKEILSENENSDLKQLEDILAKREEYKELPNISEGSINLIMRFISSFPLDKLFAIVDIVRLLILFPSANKSLISTHKDFLKGLFTKYLSPKQTESGESIPNSLKLMLIRVAANLFSTKEGSEFVVSELLELSIDAVLLGLDNEDTKYRLSGSTLAYNLCIFLPKNDEDSVMRILSAVIHSLKTEKDPEAEFTSLMAIGKLLKENQLAVDLASTLDFDPRVFNANSKLPKTQIVAKEISILMGMK